MDMQVSGDPSRAARAESGADELVFLAGRPPMSEFSEYVKNKAVNGHRLDEAELVVEWRAAHEHLKELEKTEAGLCDEPNGIPLSPNLAQRGAQALERPEAQATFRLLPCSWQLVEMDRLIVTQRSVNLRFVSELVATLPCAPTEEDLMAWAIGHSPIAPALRVTRLSDRLFAFASPSTNLRFLETARLEPTVVEGHCPGGSVAAVIGVFVGFGVNFFSAVQIHRRLILLNGTHRMYALRRMGIRHVPCLVRHAVASHDLELACAADVERQASVYLHAPRPPLFKDYFNPKLHKRFLSQRSDLVLQLQLNTQHWRMPTG